MNPAEKVKAMIDEAVATKIDEKIAEMNGNGEISPEQRAEIERQAIADHEADKFENEARIRGKNTSQDWVQSEDGSHQTKQVPFWNHELQRQRQKQASEMRRKSIDAQTSIPGSMVDAPRAGVWQQEFEEEFFGLYCELIPLAGGASFKTSEISGFETTNRTSEASERTSYSGDLSSTTHTLKNYESTFRFSRNVGADIMGIEQEAQDGLRDSILQQIETEFLALIKAEIIKKDGTQKTTSGTSGTLSTTSNILSHLSAVLQKVSPKNRRGGRWLLSSDTFATLSMATTSSGEFALRPMSEGMGLWNYPVHLTDKLPTTKTDGDLKGVFISCPIALRLGVLENYILNRFTETLPGSTILIANARVREVLLNANALSGLVVGA